eukprot:TRINITY_DN16452_c0_g2_i1.p1 TRINITY_DN16452_c0_g2~~TRINITY_DN16452_c0_g2_i1.p1  ORF type:complete len:231 (-),score=48.10 TRINITY_DN16452_c0_g2_i1:96-788(-)
MRELGLQKKDHVVCYDHAGVTASPKVWWTLKYFGFENVRVLNGGFPKWLKLNLPVAEGQDLTAIDTKGDYQFVANSKMRANFQRIRSMEILITRNLILDRIIDFRPANYEETSEPIKDPAVKRDCIFGAVNIPPEVLFNSDKITLKSPKELYFYFTDSKLDITKNIVAYSRTGFGACVGLLALSHASAENLSLYDGGWLQYVEKPAYKLKGPKPTAEWLAREEKEMPKDD